MQPMCLVQGDWFLSLCVRWLLSAFAMRGIGGSVPSTDKIICEYFPGDRVCSQIPQSHDSAVLSVVSELRWTPRL